MTTTGRLVSRRTALKTLGATAGAVTILPFLSDEGLAAFAEVQKAKAAPVLKVLTPAQYATVEALVEAIIPTDERSPGAKEARVADYMDLLLSEADASLRQEWLGGLAALDAEATKRFNRPFVKLDATQLDAIMADMSRYETVEAQGEGRGSRAGRPAQRGAEAEASAGRHAPRRRRTASRQLEGAARDVLRQHQAGDDPRLLHLRDRHPQGAALQGQQGPARVRRLPDGGRQGLPVLRAEGGGLKMQPTGQTGAAGHRPRTRASTSTSPPSPTSPGGSPPPSSPTPAPGT